MSSRRFDHAAARKHYQDVVAAARKHYQDVTTARAEAEAATLAKQADALVNLVVAEVQRQIDGQSAWASYSNAMVIFEDDLRKAAYVAVARLNSEEFNCPARVGRCHACRCDCNDDQGCRWCICVEKFWDPKDQ